MRLYLDTADVAIVTELSPWGAFAGVTTNPIILARAGMEPGAAAKRLGKAQGGDVFVQLAGDTADQMESMARTLADVLPSRLMFKVPPTSAGLELVSRLRDERLWTATTALFSFGQALLAANAGADVLIPFYSRIGADAQTVVADMVSLCQRRGGRPRVLVASVKSQDQLYEVARLGAWGATIPPELAASLLHDKGSQAALDRFAAAADEEAE